MSHLQIGTQLVCIEINKLQGNQVAPPLKLGVTYTLKGVVRDKKGNPHLDVGLVSEYNYISSYETKEELPDGDKIHWCHPSRFEVL